MENAILLSAAVVALLLQNMTQRTYEHAYGGAPIAFTALVALSAAFVFFFANGFSFHFSLAALPYSVGFAVSYAAAILCTLLAMREGSMALTCLINAYALLIPTLYGMIFLHEAIRATSVVGVLLLLVSLLLINMGKGTAEAEPVRGRKGVTPRWLLFVTLSFLGNGFCSTFQKMGQLALGEEGSGDFMMLALLFAAAGFFLLSFLRERGRGGDSLLRGVYLPLLCGAANGGCNLLVLLLNGRMPASVMYPLISAGSIVLTTLVSVLFLRERLSRLQWGGMAIGVFSIVLLNL